MLTPNTSDPLICLVCAAGAALLPLLALPTTCAHAHDAPYAGALVHDQAQDTALLVTNRGLVLRDPKDGGHFRLVCNEVLGIPTTPLPQVTITADGALVAATTIGLRRSDDGGCNWQPIPPFERDQVSSMATDPSDRDHLIAASNGAERSAFHRSRDGGRTWTELHAMDKSRLVQSLLFSPHDEQQLFATGTWFAPDGIEFFLMHSVDAGATWQTVAIPAAAGQSRMLLQAIHPQEPGTVLLSSVPFDPEEQVSQLWLSEDGGATFVTTFSAPAISAARYDARGQLWVAAGDGLYVYGEELTGFTQVTTAERLTCLSITEDTIWACGDYEGTGTTGVGQLPEPKDIQAIPAALARLLEFSDVDAPIDCPEGSQAATQCARPWYDWEIELLGRDPSMAPVTVDQPDAGEPAAVPAPAPTSMETDDGDQSPPSKAGGCNVADADNRRGGVSLWLWLTMLVALALGRRRVYR